MLPDFNRLRVFFHVLRARSASAAAAELHVTQSAVSQSLAKLEEELGAQLFVRRHRRLVPTAAATRLFAVVSPFVDALEGSVSAIHRAQHELVGALRIGAPVELGAHRLPPVLAGFRRAHPGVSFELTLGHPSELLPLLEAGRLDLAFLDVFESMPDARTVGLEVVEVMDESLVLVAARAYEAEVLAGSRALAKIGKASFVAYRPGAPAIRAWFRHHFGRVPARIEVALVVENVRAVIAAVGGGMGLGLVPEDAVREEVAAGRLVVVGTRRGAQRNRVSLVRVADRVPSKLERTFVRRLEGWPGEGRTKAGPRLLASS